MAIFLTSMDIIDTGFLKVGRVTPSDRGTTQAVSGKRINSGSALRLKAVDMEIMSTSNIDDEAIPGKFNGSTALDVNETIQSAHVSSNPTTVKFTLKLNTKNTDTSNSWGINDMSLLPKLIMLPHTPWFKACYYPVDNTATPDDRNLKQQALYQLGTKDTTQDQGDMDLTLWTGATSAASKDLTDVNYIAVRFISVSILNTPDNMITLTLNGVITE